MMATTINELAARAVFIRDRQEEPVARYNDLQRRGPLHPLAIRMRMQYRSLVETLRNAAAAATEPPACTADPGTTTNAVARAAHSMEMIPLADMHNALAATTRRALIARKWREPLRRAIQDMTNEYHFLTTPFAQLAAQIGRPLPANAMAAWLATKWHGTSDPRTVLADSMLRLLNTTIGSPTCRVDAATDGTAHDTSHTDATEPTDAAFDEYIFNIADQEGSEREADDEQHHHPTPRSTRSGRRRRRATLTPPEPTATHSRVGYSLIMMKTHGARPPQATEEQATIETHTQFFAALHGTRDAHHDHGDDHDDDERALAACVYEDDPDDARRQANTQDDNDNDNNNEDDLDDDLAAMDGLNDDYNDRARQQQHQPHQQRQRPQHQTAAPTAPAPAAPAATTTVTERAPTTTAATTATTAGPTTRGEPPPNEANCVRMRRSHQGRTT